MRKTTTLTTLLLLGAAMPAIADTVIKTSSPGEGVDTVSIHGDWARMESAQESEYQLWNLKTGAMYMVSPKDHTIMDFKPKRSKGQSLPPGIKVELKKAGKGPKIAGYSTTEYHLIANGRTCSKEYISPAAGKNKDIKRLMANLAQFDLDSLMPGGMATALRAMQDPCDTAEQVMERKVMSLGLPLKSVDQDGEVESETVSIDHKTKLDPKLFAMPAGYKHTTVAEAMGDAMKEMQQMMQNIPPEGQQFLQQLLGGGGQAK